ncbi:peptidase M23 [Alteromonas sediminis]|uniref:Peptidase M23 n=1 Tax=Alteromonas sediminis TaxID=2259342 RepID=A0A3N5YE29_9ALTE|nr:peptidoglycan DD-metalloendopeptidase family protein [Alteromonas sediminis]RPJ67865.1 peptidase M23 [Alteromonas sediminis]
MRPVKLFSSLPKAHQISITMVTGFMCFLLLLPSDPATASRHTESTILEVGQRYPLALSYSAVENVVPAALLEESWESVTVKRGDTLAKIFQRIGFSPRDTHRVSRAGEPAKTLVTLLPGDELRYRSNEEGGFAALQYALSATKTLIIEASEDGELTSRVEEQPVEVRAHFAQGEITSNFWNAASRAGLSDNQIMRLASIFGWDIDFAMEIREGDTFNVVFEEKYLDGEFIGHGDIIAAEFVNQGEQFQAILHSDGNYYTPEGRSMRKSFLRAPINFKYVSSNFNPRRFHPVLKRWKAHRGVDYVARVGTPVMAAGDGKVIKSSYDKLNGHHVFIQHGEKYTTKYLHFKSRAVKKGEIVKQGQTIGYLGATGRVTGAHLHYEFLVDGVHRNPRTVSLPKAMPIANEERESFEAIAAASLKKLNASKRIMIAMNQKLNDRANISE